VSISLNTQSSLVIDGRCTGCGRFIKRNESHFHSTERRKFRGPPRAHLWIDGGGMVTRCDDPARAAEIIQRKYLRDEIGSAVEPEERWAAEAVFPVSRGVVERGRVQPDFTGVYSWVWYPVPDHAKGPGITTAVVWYP
jgi:hypothetical protein